MPLSCLSSRFPLTLVCFLSAAQASPATRLDYLRRHLFGVSRAIASVQTAAAAPLTRSLLSARNNAIAAMNRGEDCMPLFDACDFIEGALSRLFAGRTAIIIAHRLSTIRSVDRILVLHRGQVVEQGSHEALLAREGRYAGWADGIGAEILAGGHTLGALADKAVADGIDPSAVSGRQEHLENEVNRIIWGLQ